MLSASGALASSISRPSSGLTAKLTTRYGFERSPAYNRRWSGENVIGMTVPATATVSTGASAPFDSSRLKTEMSWLSAFDTYAYVAACEAPDTTAVPNTIAATPKAPLTLMLILRLERLELFNAGR